MGFLEDLGLSHLISKIKATFFAKKDAVEVVEIEVDSTPTEGSENLVTSGGVKSYVDNAIPDAVEANPTVPSGTTPTTLQNVKVGDDYYSVPQASSPVTISTNIDADKADNTKAGGAKAIYDFVKPASQSSIPQGGLLPGIKYHLGTLTGSVTMTLASPSDASVENEYKGDFTADSTPPSISWQGVTEWAGNCLDDQTGEPLLTGGKHYEFNIENGYGFIAEFGV